MSRLWTCQPEWAGGTTFIVCGGASARGLDLRLLKGRKVIAVNSSFFAVPFADFLYFSDSRWWYHYQAFSELKNFAGRIVSTTVSRVDPRVLLMQKVKPPPGLTDNRSALSCQYTSLQGAMNLAYHLGVARMVLVGADNRPAEDGTMYHHRPHPESWKPKPDHFDLQRANLALTRKPLKRAGIEVINASQQSRLEWWPKKPFEECLQWP